MPFLAAVVRYLHYTLGITTPRPEQERMFVFIWIGATVLIVIVAVTFFLLLVSQIR